MKNEKTLFMNLKQEAMKKSRRFFLLPAMAAALPLLLPACGHEPEDDTLKPPFEINAANFPDDEFRDFVANYLDPDADGWLSEAEIRGINWISMRGGGPLNLAGLWLFRDLIDLSYIDGSLSGEQDFSRNELLNSVFIQGRGDTSTHAGFKVREHPSLKSFSLDGIPLDRLDISGSPFLNYLSIAMQGAANHYPKAFIDARGCRNLQEAYLYANMKTVLSADFSGCTALETLSLTGVATLVALDLEGCENLLEKRHLSGAAYVVTDALECFDLQSFPEGFDLSRAGNWQGARIEGNTLVFTGELSRQEGPAERYYCTYQYDTRCPVRSYATLSVTLYSDKTH